MYALLDRALKTVMEKGTLRVTGPDGKIRDYGDGTGTIKLSPPEGSAGFAFAQITATSMKLYHHGLRNRIANSELGAILNFMAECGQ